MDFATIAPWIQLGFAGAFAAYLLMKTIPRMEDRADKRDATFADALSHVIDRHEAQQQLQREHNERQSARLHEAINDLGAEMRGHVAANGHSGGRGDRGTRG